MELARLEKPTMSGQYLVKVGTYQLAHYHRIGGFSKVNLEDVTEIYGPLPGTGEPTLTQQYAKARLSCLLDCSNSDILWALKRLSDPNKERLDTLWSQS